jgi:predicted DNA-binding protein
MTARELQLASDYLPSEDVRTKISADDKAELDRLARRTGRTEAQLTRLILHSWLSEAREAESQS